MPGWEALLPTRASSCMPSEHNSEILNTATSFAVNLAGLPTLSNTPERATR